MRIRNEDSSNRCSFLIAKENPMCHGNCSAQISTSLRDNSDVLETYRATVFGIGAIMKNSQTLSEQQDKS
jgi:hypothetical protein